MDPNGFQWQSSFDVSGPKGAYYVGLQPGSLKVNYAETLAAAPVYTLGGGKILLTVNDQPPGAALGKWAVGKNYELSLNAFIAGDRVNNKLCFYHAEIPGGSNKTSPVAILRVKDPTGALLEDIPFAGGCG